MIEYIEHKRSVVDSLAQNLTPVSTDDLIGHLLSGLDSSYEPFITAFMVKGDNSTIDDLVGMLLLEESRLEQDHLRQASMQPPVPTSFPNSSQSVALNVNRSQYRALATGPSSAHYRYGDSRRK